MLATHSSSKTKVLEVAFGPAWWELVLDIVWEIIDKKDPSEVALNKKFWGFTVKITYGELAWVFRGLFGARP